jgi:hypothetical protein
VEVFTKVMPRSGMCNSVTLLLVGPCVCLLALPKQCMYMQQKVWCCISNVSDKRELFFEPCEIIIDYILLCSCVTGKFVRSVRVLLVCVVQSNRITDLYFC